MHDLMSTGGLILKTAGTAAAPFVVSGAGAGKTMLSGGVLVKGFAERLSAVSGAREWRVTLPANTTYFRQLFVRSSSAGKFMRRFTARSATMAYDHSVKTNPQYAIVYQPGQVRPSYHNQDDVLATLYHCWTATTHHINNIHSSNRT
jgi:hypothetical protein